MFFIFGWNRTQVTDYGSVQEQQCPNCHNKDIWKLKKISKYFTLFFIPIFPHDSENFYHCPICNYGFKLGLNDFENYKAIAKVNEDRLEERITEDERLSRLDKIQKAIDGTKETRSLKDKEDSKNWAAKVSEKSTDELQLILNKKSEEYNASFIVAVRMELQKRKGTTE